MKSTPLELLERRRGENPITHWLGHLLEMQVPQGEVSAVAE